jgi:hypothetical protein
MNMCQTFFEGREKFRSILANAVTSKRNELRLSEDEVNAMCRLGCGSVRCQEYESDHSQMDARTFRRVSLPLGVSVNLIPEVSTALQRLATTEGLRDEVKQDMKRNCAALQGGCGKGDPRDVSLDKQMPVYVVLRALREIM